jgi:two-component system, chemotaxis family, CheB/CheR fusion protein
MSRRNVRIVIAEDEPDTLMTLGALLQAEDFDVRLTSGGAEVPALVRDFRPDAVLLDIGMPDRDGYKVAQDLRSTFGDGCPTLIALTAYAMPSDKARAETAGFHHHIAKPYDPAHLVDFLSALNR